MQRTKGSAVDMHESRKDSGRRSMGLPSNEGRWYSHILSEIGGRQLPGLAKLLKEMETPLILLRIFLFDRKAGPKFDIVMKTVSGFEFLDNLCDIDC